jgi:fatty-acyl-CoA synthase
MNFRFKKEELIYIINNCEPKVLIFGPEFSSLVGEAKSEFTQPVQLLAISEKAIEGANSFFKLMEGRSKSELAVTVDPASPCSIMYTSGTTGFPKGSLSSHKNLMNILIGMVYEGDLNHNDVTMVPLPLFHNGGLNGLLQPTLIMGGTAVIMKKGFDPDVALDTISRYAITLTMLVPTQLAMVVNHPEARKYNVSTLRKIWYGSSPISPTVLEASMDLFKAGFYQWYGQAETGMVSVLRPEDHVDRSQCTGREMFNAELRVVDEEGKDTPVGEVGEIISTQDPLGMIGYFKMEEATRRTIRNGWIHTEDLARVDGKGYFTVVDRLRDMIISGAENIYPKEIEDVIMSHPGVREVAVFGIPDDIYGEAVCAVVVKKEGHQLDEKAMIEFCASKLAGYKKPKRVDFINELPKNPTGKVTKNVLRESYWAGRKKRI